MSFKGILRYAIYGFIGAWMFLLGIMVGRGTAPVSFDTGGFQARLESIARQFGKPAKAPEKINLGYYDALNDPDKPEALEQRPPASLKRPGAQNITQEPGQADTMEDDPETVPVKTSKKAATLKKKTEKVKKNKPPRAAARKAPVPQAKPPAKTVSPPKNKTAAKPPAKPAGGSGAANAKTRYTIQVAAYKDFKDAVTHMAALEKKGFSANRTTKKIDGVTWYRVRMGAFATYNEAGRYVKKLNQAGINGMIIKKE